jgi:RAD51-like protein 3
MVRLDRLLRGEWEGGQDDQRQGEEEEEGVFDLGRDLKSLETFLLATKTDLKRRPSNHLQARANETLDKLERRVLGALARKTRVVDGIEMFNSLQKSVLLPTGVSTLDTLLGGGLREGQVTELYGASPSGKTQICHCVCACAAWLDFSVVYLTSNGSFSPERLVKLSRHVMHHFDLTEQEALCGGSLQKILSNVSIHQVSDTLSLVAIFQSMFENFGYLLKHGKQVPKVVVVDSPSLLLYRDLTSSHAFGRLLMVQLSSAMKQLATKFNVAIVITNHAVQSNTKQQQSKNKGMNTETEHSNTRTESEVKPGLGQVWSPQANVRVHLKLFKYAKEDDQEDRAEPEKSLQDVNGNARPTPLVVCRATLAKVSTSASGGEAWMTIGENVVKGINPLGPENTKDISAWNN